MCVRVAVKGFEIEQQIFKDTVLFILSVQFISTHAPGSSTAAAEEDGEIDAIRSRSWILKKRFSQFEKLWLLIEHECQEQA